MSPAHVGKRRKCNEVLQALPTHWALCHRAPVQDVPDIIIVEDDPEIRRMTAELLGDEGWSTLSAPDGETLDGLLAKQTPRLLILDINLPGEDGLSICKRVSQDTDIAILMLSARREDLDRIIGLEIGADDYLGKPFHPRELTARVRALLRRFEKSSAREGDVPVVRACGFTVNASTRRATAPDDKPLSLSGAEFDLLYCLAEARGRVLSRDFLLDRIHGRTQHPFDRSIDVLVSRLRKKIDPVSGSRDTVIESVRGEGYALRHPLA